MTKNLVSEVSIIDGIVVNSRPVNRRVTDANEGSHLMEKGQRASLTHSRWDGGGTGRVVAMATQLSLFICFTTHQIQRAIILFPSRFHRFQLPKEIQFDVSTSLAAFAKLKSSERCMLKQLAFRFNTNQGSHAGHRVIHRIPIRVYRCGGDLNSHMHTNTHTQTHAMAVNN